MLIEGSDTLSIQATAAAVAGATDDLTLPPTTTAEEAPAELPKGLTAEEAATFGWEERAAPNSLEEKLIDPANAETVSEPAQSETEEVTAASPGSGQDASGNVPAPQLDPNQQFQLMLYQQMQESQKQQMEFQRQLVESLRPPKPPAPEVDPLADLPEEFKAIPGIDKLARYIHDKNRAEVTGFKTELEDRIKNAARQRTADRYANEAVGIGSKVLAKGFVFDKPEDSAVVTDGLRDFTLTLADVRGGSPAEYEQAMHRIIDTAVRGRINFLNQQAKAKVAQRHAPAKPQIVATSSIPTTAQNTEPGIAEVRAAGYRDLEDARWDDFSKVHAKRARARG